MVQTLESIKGGGGSVKVGTVGTISSLMIRELQSSTSHTTSSTDEASSSGKRTGIKHRSPETIRRTTKVNQTQHRIPVVSTNTTTPKRLKQKAPLEDVGNSNTVSKGSIGRRSPEASSKPRTHKRSYHIPMLGAENIHLEKTPVREKPMKKGSSNMVDIVDINCGNPGVTISSRLKKLGFSKLSQSFM